MKTPTTACHLCKGTGQVTLPASLATTLARFNAKARFTASDLHEPESDISINAINNRLEKLRELGFLSRERDGRLWRYSKAKPGAEASAEAEAETAAPEKPAAEKPTKSKAGKKAGGKGAAKTRA